MDQQQQIETAITALNNSKQISSNRVFKNISILVKALDKYSIDEQILPSERFIPCCLFVVPQKICELIGHDPSALLGDKPEKMGHRILLNMYLKALLKLLQESADEIKHIIIEGMSRSILLIAPYPQLTKKWMKVLLQLWGTSNENLQIPLRCHLALSKFLSKCESNIYMWGLRRMYVSFFENCKQVSWRNFEHINFMTNSFCQIVKFDTQRAYYVLFGYLRSISLELDKFHKSKRKEKVEIISKLFSNQILNCFKLFTAVISRVQAEDFTALIYPLCQMFAAYERITQSPQYIPLKLHLLEYELTIIESLGVYIPHTLQMIEKLIKCPTFNRKIAKKSEKVQANIELAYKVSKAQLSQALLINQLFRSLVTKIFWFESLMCKTVYGPEVIMKLHKILKGHKYIFSQYQQQAQKAAALIKKDNEVLYEMRAQQKLSLSVNKKIKKFEQKIKEATLSGPERYIQLKTEEEQLLRDKLAAEQEEGKEAEEEQDYEQGARQDEDQVNSGWEQASQGASQLDPKQIEGSQEQEGDQQVENVSYEGDPQDADQAAKQWSEQQWSSQNDINEE